MIQNIKKIAVLRANALGDFIFSLPALTALKETYPHAELVYLGIPWHKAFLQNRPSPVDRVIVVPPSRGIRTSSEENEKELRNFFREMQKESFDIAIQLHGGGKYSNPFLLRLSASLTIGLKTPDAIPLDRWVPYIYYHNEYLRYLEVVALIGATTNRVEPFIPVTPSDVEEVSQKIPELKQPYIVIHPGATDIRRRWPVEKFAKIGDFLFNEGYSIIVTGTDSEKNVVYGVVEAMHSPATPICNKLSLNGLTGLLSLATCIVSNDTGPLHLASALMTPTVGIYWCGNMINGAQVTRSYHRNAISWITHCPLCKSDCASTFPFHPEKKDCKHLTSFVTDVSVVEVQEILRQLLEERQQTKIPKKELLGKYNQVL